MGKKSKTRGGEAERPLWVPKKPKVRLPLDALLQRFFVAASCTSNKIRTFVLVILDTIALLKSTIPLPSYLVVDRSAWTSL